VIVQILKKTSDVFSHILRAREAFDFILGNKIFLVYINMICSFFC